MKKVIGIIVLPAFLIFVPVYYALLFLFGHYEPVKEVFSDVWEAWKMAYWE